MRLFMDEFRKLGNKETRCVEVFNKGDYGSLPPDQYAFIEHFCDEKNCDCRRVMISVFGHNAREVLATISMGFDSEADDAGPFLDPLNPQSEHANDFMELFLQVINGDPNYLARLQRHYVMFKEKVDGKSYTGKLFETPGRIERRERFSDLPAFPESKPAARGRPKVGRNQPCPCGSGKKYKSCCLTRGSETVSMAPNSTVAGGSPGARGSEAKTEAAEVSNEKESIEDAKAMVQAVARCMQSKKQDKLIDRHTARLISDNPLIAFPLLHLLIDDYAREGTAKEMSLNYRACLILLEEALTEIRYSVERNRQWAVDAAARIQQEMAARAFRVEVDARVPADLVAAIHEAKLEHHSDIKAKTEELADYYGRFMTHKRSPNLDRLFDGIASKNPEDAFAFMQQIMGQLEILPVEGQLLAVAEMAKAGNPLVRELAALMLLHPSREVRLHVPSMYAEVVSPKGVSPVALRRMIGLRNWLPEDERPALDSLINKLRAARVECAPMPPPQRIMTYASPFDGAGAQGIWIVVGQKRSHRIMSVLLKQGAGIRDVMGLDHLSKKDIDTILQGMSQQTMSLQVDPSYMNRVVSHFIWVGRQQSNPPQAGLLQVAEALGVEYWAPRRLVAEEELSKLGGATDPLFLTPDNVTRVLQGSGVWPAQQAFASSWFEDDSRVDEIVRSDSGIFRRTRRPTAKKAAAQILHEIIEPKYDIWAERLLCMTLWAKACKDISPLPWEDFFIVARQFEKGTPAERFPLLVAAAERSVYSALERI